VEIVIAAIDPGTVKVGYCFMSRKGTSVEFGVIKPASKALHERLRDIQDALDRLFARFRPAEVAVETPYVGRNAGSALTLAGGRAMAMVSAARVGAKVFEYTAPEAKKAVTASGCSSKEGVRRVIQLMLGLKDPPPEDAADAVALALLHSGRAG